MKWGIVFASTAFPEPDRAIAMAQAAEQAGFESLWCPEHVVVAVGDNVTPYSGSADGKMDRLWRRGGIPDPLIWLAFVAGSTHSINLGTNVVVVPEHQPTVLAKSAATLDALAGGRLLLGIGVGELPEEYAAVGMEFTNRGRRMDESIEAMRELWTEEVASYHGRFVDFAGIDAYPRPVQRPVPFVIGGHMKASLRRAVTRGHGWYGFMTTPESTARCLDALRETASRVERPVALGRLEITVTPYGPFTHDQARAYADLGVDRVVPWHIDWTRFPGDAVLPSDWRGVEAAIEADLRALD